MKINPARSLKRIIIYVYILPISLYSMVIEFTAAAEQSPAGGAVSSVQKNLLKESSMGKPNFNFQKRQKELAKKKKNEEKRQRKLDKNAIKPSEDPGQTFEGGEVKIENGG